MIEPLSLFIANFAYIFLKAFQQKNIQHDNYPLIMPTSLGMACCEYFIMGTIALVAVGGHSLAQTVLNIAAIGTGAGLGAMCAMYKYNQMRKNSEVKSKHTKTP
jgi:FtsH-binding integral membrane protein